MIKPDFWQDEVTNGRLSMPARLAYIASWNIADDEGRLRGAIPYLHGQIFPFDDDVDMASVKAELAAAGKWVCYEVNGQQYLLIPNFEKHQTINRPQPSSIPSPQELAVCVISVNDSVNHSRPNRREEKGIEEKRSTDGDSAAGAAVSDLDAFFDNELWPIYPKKASKAISLKALHKINPSAELRARIVSAINQQRKSIDWTKENGRYVPHMSTWLNGQRWEDEVSPATPNHAHPISEKPSSERFPGMAKAAPKPPDRANYDTWEDYAEECRELGFEPMEEATCP